LCTEAREQPRAAPAVPIIPNLFPDFPFFGTAGTDAALTGLASGQWLVDGERHEHLE
jgi:hypothetical protein